MVDVLVCHGDVRPIWDQCAPAKVLYITDLVRLAIKNEAGGGKVNDYLPE